MKNLVLPGFDPLIPDQPDERELEQVAGNTFRIRSTTPPEWEYFARRVADGSYVACMADMGSAKHLGEWLEEFGDGYTITRLKRGTPECDDAFADMRKDWCDVTK